MKVKSFNNYRAPRRHDWLYGLLAVLLLVGFVLLVKGCVSGCVEHRAAKRAERVAEMPDQAGADAEEAPAGSAEIPSAPAIPTPGASARITKARKLERSGDLLAARDLYWELLPEVSGKLEQREVETRLGSLNVLLLLSPRPCPEKVDYVVRSGDTVARIANGHGTTVELVKMCNGLENANLIKVGDRLRIPTATFAITSSKLRNDLLVTMNGKFFKRYRVGSGKFGKTPTGSFVVKEKIKEPVWWRPDGSRVDYGKPGNVLGTRWLSLKATEGTEDVRGYGIHGTWEDDSIGRASSQGCLRMHNSDVEELFVYIPSGTTVTITE